jgi:cbb3-type cytochrome oxidase subunit 1
MKKVARYFFTLAILYGVAGMMIGLHMSMTHDHGQMPVHAHAMVAGWLMSAVFAFFYHLFPEAEENRLATVHFWLQSVSGIVLLTGLYVLLAGNPSVEPVVAASSLAFFAGLILFAWIAIPLVWRSPSEERLGKPQPAMGGSSR